jgi:DNA-binding NtrC family response regulator
MELIQMNRPDLVVVDMPPGDNEVLGVCRDIRKAHEDLPVILSTVYATFKPDAKSQDAERCACSDWDIEELKGLIQRTVEGNEGFPPGVVFNEGDGCVYE